MSSVDEFVRTSILTYPSLYKSRTDVLHHALCVIGNGYEWGKDGTVVIDYGEPHPLWNKQDELAELETYLEQHFSTEFIRSVVREGMIKHIDECVEIVEQAEERTHMVTPIESFYPECKEYALIHNTPENITDDWAEACAEMRVLAIAAGWTF